MISNDPCNTLILTVHNREKEIGIILDCLYKYTSPISRDLIIVLDGCTDNTHEVISHLSSYLSTRFNLTTIVTDDVWETKANNEALRICKTDFATIIQDDMHIYHPCWDNILLDTLNEYNLFSISGRDCHGFTVITPSRLIWRDVRGRDSCFPRSFPLSSLLSRSFVRFPLLFKLWAPVSINLISNRGPWMLDMKIVRQLDLLDESFAPFELDDADICCRAFKQFGLLSGSRPIFYKEVSGAKQSNDSSAAVSRTAIAKNMTLFISRHGDLSI